MSFNFTDINEYFRFLSDKINMKLFIVSAKDGEYFVTISPTVLVSGYGTTEEESKESFKYNLQVFCEDLLELSSEERDNELINLGFAKEEFKTMNFSKLYVDENGVLQGLDHATIKTSVLEAEV